MGVIRDAHELGDIRYLDLAAPVSTYAATWQLCFQVSTYTRAILSREPL